MNVTKNDEHVSVPLLQVLSMLTEGTTAYVECDGSNHVYIRGIDRASDVLKLHGIVRRETGHLPQVYEIDAVSADLRCVVVLKCR